MFRHVLVAIDGSAGADHAARVAAGLAKQLGARLTVLVVVQPPTAVPLPFDAVSIAPAFPDPAHLEVARATIDAVVAELGDQATPVTALGPPVETIVSEAARLGADLVVVGARGLGALGRLLLGSVSEQVVRTCTRPVLVVHPPGA